jgi:hypothetical protein
MQKTNIMDSDLLELQLTVSYEYKEYIYNLAYVLEGIKLSEIYCYFNDTEEESFLRFYRNLMENRTCIREDFSTFSIDVEQLKNNVRVLTIRQKGDNKTGYNGLSVNYIMNDQIKSVFGNIAKIIRQRQERL